MTITLTWWIICLALSCPILAYIFWPRKSSGYVFDFTGVLEAFVGIIALLVIWLIGALCK